MTQPSDATSPAPRIVGPWRTSTYSDSKECVALAPTSDPGLVAMRNSKDHSQGTLLVPRGALAHLITRIKTGALDNLS